MSVSSVLEATEQALATQSARSTPRGQAALVLAARIDSGDEKGAALAALLKELRFTLDDIERTAPAEHDPVAAAQADLGLRLVN